MRRHPFGRSTLAIVALLATSSCSSDDKATDCSLDAHKCAPGFFCELETRTCMPKEAGVPDIGVKDGGVKDSQGDGEVSDTATDAAGLKANGASCSQKSECESGFCADGVCCNTACDGPCISCKLSGKLGICSATPAGEDPEGDCAGKAPGCAGSCNGGGACTFPGKESSCGTPTCKNGERTVGECDTAGSCNEKKESCGGLACADATRCLDTCTKPADCLGTDVTCSGGNCVATKPLGTPCGANNKLCASGFCVDGVCCASACDQPCQVCNAAGKEGSCSAEADGTTCGAESCAAAVVTTNTCKAGSCKTSTKSCDFFQCAGGGSAACKAFCSSASDCVAGAYCDGAGICRGKKANGVGCTTTQECLSGLCTSKEKVCCDRACGGDCESCAGKSSCTLFTAGTPCGAATSCKDDTAESFVSAWSCKGGSSCEETRTDCQGFTCATPTTCRSSCTKHSECVSGLCGLVSAGQCVPVADVCQVDAAASAGGVGTLAAPYQTITACLLKTQPFVRVADGNYSETLTFTTSTTVIAASAPATSTGLWPAKVIVTLSSLGVIVNSGVTATIRGIDFKNGPLETRASATLSLRDSRIDDAPGNALTNAGEMTLEDVYVRRAGSAGIQSSGVLTLRRVEVYSSGANGIDLAATSQTTGTNVEAHTSASTGIYSRGQLDLEGVVVHRNVNSGLRTQGSGKQPRIRNLVAIFNGGVGLFANDVTTQVAYATLAMNDIQNNIPQFQISCAVGSVSSGAGVWVYNSIVYGAQFYSGDCFYAHSIARDGGHLTHDIIFVDPQFERPTQSHFCSSVPSDFDCYDFSLKSSSPARNMGTPTLPAGLATSKDIEGTARDSTPNMGAYE